MNVLIQHEVHREGTNLVLSEEEFRSRLSAVLHDLDIGEQEILEIVKSGFISRYIEIIHGTTVGTDYLIRLVFLEDNFRHDFASSTEERLVAHS